MNVKYFTFYYKKKWKKKKKKKVSILFGSSYYHISAPMQLKILVLITPYEGVAELA